MLSFKTALRSGVALAACACSASLTYAQSGPGWSGQGYHAAPAYSTPAYGAPGYGAPVDPRAPCPEQAQARAFNGHTQHGYAQHGYAQPHHAYAQPQTYAQPVVVHERATYGRVAHNRPAASVAYVRTRQGPTPVAIEYEYEAAAEPSSRLVYDTRGSRWR